MTSKKFLAIAIMCIGIFAIVGCSKMFSNPMKYIVDEDVNNDRVSLSNREEETDSEKETVAEKKDEESKIVKVMQTKNSETMTSKDYVALSKEVNDILASEDTEGLVIVQDSYILEDVCYFLQLTVKEDKKPLIIVPVASKNYNFDSDVNNAKDFIEGKNQDLNEGLVLIKALGESAFDLSNTKDLPIVSIVYDYSGNDAIELERAIDRSEGVVIVPSYSANNLSSEALKLITAKVSMPIAISCDGDVSVKNATLLEGSQDAFYARMTPVKARILLMLSINSKHKKDQILDDFYKY